MVYKYHFKSGSLSFRGIPVLMQRVKIHLHELNNHKYLNEFKTLFKPSTHRQSNWAEPAHVSFYHTY